jgi:hypothetical protein
MSHRPLAVLADHCARVVAVYVIADERQSPIKGPHEAIVVSLMMCAFARVHECFPQNLKTSVVVHFEGAILKAHADEIKRDPDLNHFITGK